MIGDFLGASSWSDDLWFCFLSLAKLFSAGSVSTGGGVSDDPETRIFSLNSSFQSFYQPVKCK